MEHPDVSVYNDKLVSIYSRCLITKNISIPITSIGKNIKETI